MQGFWWKWSGLRRLSMVGRGIVEAFFVTLVAAAGCFVIIEFLHLAPSRTTSETLAQVGATILVAYGVEASWILKRSHVRSRNRENWVGVASGVAYCGLIGIAFALALSSENPASHTALHRLLLAWSMGSIGFLGLFVALVPQLVYDWTHQMDGAVEDDD